MKKVLLLDIENLHQTEKQLFQYLKQYQQVYLVYAKSPVNFSLDALVLLSPYVVNGKLKVLKMPKIGKNAADFGLAFIAGQLSTQLKPKEYSFDVMSNDHSMEYVVDLLKIAEFEAKLIQDKPLVSAQILKELKSEFDLEKMMREYCGNLKKVNFSKPAKLESLINSLKANLKIEEDIAKAIIVELQKSKILKIDDLKIQYHLNALEKYLSSTETAEALEKKLSHIRLCLSSYLNEHSPFKPRYILGFTVLLERCLPKNEVKQALYLLEKYKLISIEGRQVNYNPILLAS